MLDQFVQTIEDWCNETCNYGFNCFSFNNEFSDMSKEGSTEAPIRHPIDFENPDFKFRKIRC